MIDPGYVIAIAGLSLTMVIALGGWWIARSQRRFDKEAAAASTSATAVAVTATAAVEAQKLLQDREAAFRDMLQKDYDRKLVDIDKLTQKYVALQNDYAQAVAELKEAVVKLAAATDRIGVLEKLLAEKTLLLTLPPIPPQPGAKP